MPVLDHIARVTYDGIVLAHVARIGYGSQVAHVARHSLNAPAVLDHVARYAMTTRGQLDHVGRHDLLTGNPAQLDHRSGWSLLRSSVIVRTGRPFLLRQGRRIEITEASVALDEGGQFWTARIGIARGHEAAQLSRFDAVTLDIHGDQYALVVESLNRSRASEPGQGGGTRQVFDVVCRSPLWVTIGSDAPKVTKTWATAVLASAAAEELAGEEIDWRIIDWTIPAGQLAAVNEPAIEVIARIVGAAGGVIECDADGTLIARYRYPVSIPNAATTPADHDLSESTGIVSLSERMQDGTRFDRVTLSTKPEQQGYLSAERDTDQPDVVFGGEQQRFLVFRSPDVDIADVQISAGTLLDLGDTVVEIEDEEVTFSNSDQARTAKPVRGDFAYTWFGAGLGAITVAADGLTLRAAQSGVGVARASYTAAARRYAVIGPTTAGGRAEYPVAVYVVGALKSDAVAAGNTATRIVVQRGAGMIAGDDIIEPLAGSENVLLNRGRNEIDAAAAKGLVTLETVYQSEGTDSARVMPGQLVTVDDTQLGRAWRGKVTAVEHRVAGVGLSSLLSVERFLP